MMKRKLFGTDGIRGKANVYPMTCEVAMRLGRAVTHYFQTQSGNKNTKPLIIVGKDTRLSCYMLEQAFSSGVCSQGGRVVLTGPLPTPGVAFVTQSMRAVAGVMISASHNNFEDNGIKIFDPSGYKLPDDVEFEIEKMILNPEIMPVKTGADLGRAMRLDEVFGRYLVYAKSAFPKDYDLADMRVVLDCANGAAYKTAPMIFSELGAEVFNLGVEPNGQNINFDSGSLHPQKTSEAVKTYRADIGICLDGDGDRLVCVDAQGKVIDGDKLIGLFARFLLDSGKIKKGDVVVGTVMSNLGLEHYVKSLGLLFHRTKVGDRYIVEQMRKDQSIIGGEPSGHIIFQDFATTGDGTLAALKALECMKFYKQSIADLVKEIVLFPQVVKSTNVQKKVPLDTIAPIKTALSKVDKALGEKGRVLLRYSGTEPLARVMVEGEDENSVHQYCDELINVVKKELGQ